MRSRTLAAWSLAALFALPLAACGDDSSGPNPGSHPAAIILNGAVDSTGYEDEATNLYFAVVQAGFPLDSTSALDSTSIAALLAGKDILFLTEYSIGFGAPAQAALAAFVEGGGTIVLVGGYNHIAWVNTAFGLSLVQGSGYSDRELMARTPEAGDTPFGAGADSIPANDGTDVLTAASLPGEAIIAYEGPNGATEGSVVVLPQGSGRLVYFAWDWYDGVPIGLQDAGWSKLLRLTAGF